MPGAYCRYCDHRCFVDRVLPDTGRRLHMATCPAGKAYDRSVSGFDADTALTLLSSPLGGADPLAVRRLRRGLGQEPTIIGVGGISSIMDAELMLDAGADLLQAYTAFIYNGPAWPGRMNRALATGSPARVTG